MDFQNLSSTDKVMGLYEFLLEAELQHYYEEFKNSLKIMKGTQLKYVTTNDLTQIGMSKPEQRRFKKMYSKYFPNNYFTKIKKLLSSGKKSDSNLPTLTEENLLEAQLYSNHSIKVPSKHIIPVENIAINKELGEGEFGVVQQGIWSNDNQRIQVAIKCLCRERMQTNSMEFLKEAAVMHSIEHPNIVRLYGVVLHSDSLMLVTELAPLRSLLECLKEISLRPNFPVLTLCDFASQICDGMSYLEAKRLIHRDLAARNILVFSKNRVKISDFGLSRALRAGKDYYQTNFNVNLKLPIAWCAPECISYLRFTSASDVWAYAVTLWEMFSYGFQPWAAFSGHQILMAIDEPNFQRLEQPDCCPDTYYGLMNKCWQHDPLARPKFHEIAFMLPECCPQQVQATVNVSHEGKRNDQLDYRLGDIITILQKGGSPNQANWKGILKNCKTGYFNPQTTMPYVKTVQQVQATNLHATSSSSSETGSNRSTSSLLGGTFRNSLLRSDSKRHTFISKRPLQREMISAPQGEMKHTGHIGLDGAYFGDVSFLDPAVSNYNNPVPRQIVTPYKPSEDLEQMPLINPNSPSHLTGSVSTPPYPLLNQDPSRPRTFDEAISLPMPKNGVDEIDSVAACDVFSSKSIRLKKLLGDSTINKTLLSKMKSATLGKSFKTSTAIAQKPSCVNAVDKNKVTDGEVPHEYHEISDTEEALSPSKMLPDSPRYDKEFSKELIAELDNMLSSLNGTDPELIVSKLTTKTEDDATGRSSHSPRASKKKLPSVKPISAYDQKTLDTAIALANELTTRSMNDLDNSYQKAPSSPIEKNKFHSKLVATLSHLGHTSHNASTHKLDGKQERRNFSKEAQSVPDLQSTFTEASKMAYASLIDQPTPSLSLMVDEARHLHQLRFNTHTGTTDNIESNRNERSSCDDNLPIMNSEVNEIPLPPRDRTKLQTISKQKHTRKHPLMAPAQNLQFSVEKIHNNNDQEDNGLVSSSNSPEQYENYSMNIKNTESNSKGNGAIPKKIVKRKLKSENNDDSSEPLYMNFEAGLLIGPREFFNVHSLHYESKIDNPQFENYDDEVDGPLNFNASTNPFSERESGNLISNPFEMGELKNPSSKEYLQFADQVSKASDCTSREKECKFVCRAIEKVEESSLSKDSPDHVSVEDLLEFAGQKPCGRQRGAESDEVRIMLKVLNQETSRAVITPEDCLQVLEYCEWDVYQTLKLVEVCFAPGIHAGIPECARALLAANGDTKQAKTLLTLQ